MERIRKQSRGGDELALVKAAAWAWYEHGTGLEGKSLQEFDIRRTFHDPIPSRFKLEAKKLAEQGSRVFDEGSSPGTSGSVQTVDHHSLLDRYEIESISRRLDQLIESSGDKGTVYNKGFLVGDRLAKLYDHSNLGCGSRCSPPPKLQVPTSAVEDLHRNGNVALSDGDYTNRRRKKTSNNFRGFWQRHVVICGSSTHKDVILGTRSFVDNRGQQQNPEKWKAYSPVPVVKLANRRPRASGHHRRLVIN
ncbi:hypothetical protein RchiOBHm_Chr3g0491241 [Rosa chinensis]|uniref:Uncharacterized protein n=1 Tax=Rosa chinensis TaxID=74649 RepID=A0A2P6RG76_ROSCH|nr:hypothetical protein RchiOBHm_Chr3g0491241 [Rosa chinensis]